MPKGMITTYQGDQGEEKAPEQPKPEGLEELEAKKLKEAQAEWKRLEEQKERAKEQDKEDRIKRLRISNTLRSLEAKLRQKETILDSFIGHYEGMIECGRQDIDLRNDAGALLAQLEADGYRGPTPNLDYMLGGGLMPDILEQYVEKTLNKVTKKYREGAELTVESMMKP